MSSQKPRFFRGFFVSALPKFATTRKTRLCLPPMNATKTRRLTRDYLAAVDRVLQALDRAKALRAALHRELARRRKGKNRGTS